MFRQMPIAALTAAACAAVAWAQQGDSYPEPTWESAQHVVLKDFPHRGTLGANRDIYVHVPKGYQGSDERYRVIYFFDGESSLKGGDGKPGRKTLDADVHLDQLIDEGLIHPAILVAIPNAHGVGHDDALESRRTGQQRPTSMRGFDLSPQKVEGEKWARLPRMHNFIVKVLKPYMDSTFRTMPEARYTGVSGCSLGASASAHLAYFRPDVYGMAGCMSVSIFGNRGRDPMPESVYRNSQPPTGVRFWFDMGALEDVRYFKSTPTVAQALAKRGWNEGRDLAVYIKPDGTHSYPSWHAIMRNMLYFLLWKEPAKVTGITLRQMDNAGKAPLDLAALGEKAHAVVEVAYEHGLRTTAVSVPIRSTDKKVATVDNTYVGQVLPVSKGETLLRADFDGFADSLLVVSYQPGTGEKLAATRRKKPPTIDGALGDWTELPQGSEPYAFAVAYDKNALYVAVKVTDDDIRSEPGGAPWSQDGIEVRIDSRKDPLRSAARGTGEMDDILLVAASPGASPGEATPVSKERLPEGTKVECVKDSSGYALEALVPVSYLDGQQGGPWSAVRVNLIVNDLDGDAKSPTKYEWRPDWRSETHQIGSGTFVKK